MSIWEKIGRYPPVLVRLLARHADGTAMSDQDIHNFTARRLSLADIKRLSYLPSWDEVPTRHLVLFCLACRVDLGDRSRVRSLNRYLKDPKFLHLKRDKNFPQYREMIRVYLESQHVK